MRVVRGGVLVLALSVLSFSWASAAAPTEAVLYSFTGGSDGGAPQGTLIADSAGNLYGTGSTGGSTKCTGGCGVVFKLSPPAKAGQAWTETVLYAFKGGSDGSTPLSGLILDGQGALYGTTAQGGGSTACTGGCGTAFQLTPPAKAGTPWTEKLLYKFVGGAGPAAPLGGLTIGPSGALYGTTGKYPSFNACLGSPCGTVYRLSPPASAGSPWKMTVLHAFTGGTDGSLPMSTLLLGANGELYGVTQLGGSTHCLNFGCGVVFEMLPPGGARTGWSEKVIHAFQGGASLGGGTDGGAPGSDLIQDFEGVLYGTTGVGPGTGCSLGCGGVFKLTPPTLTDSSWVETTLYSFKGGKDGASPETGRLAFGPPGILYGTTPLGGAASQGTVFQLTRSSPDGGWKESVLHSFQTQPDAGAPQGGLVNIAGVLYGTATKGGASKAGAVFAISGLAPAFP